MHSSLMSIEFIADSLRVAFILVIVIKKKAVFSIRFIFVFLSFSWATHLPCTACVLSSNSGVHPLVIAAHPQEPNQFAVGLSDGKVHVFEPLESEVKWGVPQLLENGSANGGPAASSAGPSGPDQAQR